MSEAIAEPKRPRGRPRKPNARHSGNTKHVTLSDVERAELEEAARVDGKDCAVYIRDAALAAARHLLSRRAA
jgi:uncharacterized protein (DUF1778 family)